MEMTCTMRNWEARHQMRQQRFLVKTSSHPDTQTYSMVVDDEHHYGPELLLQPVIEYLTNHRDDSPVRGVRRKPLPEQAAPPPPVAYSIPLNNILVVETYNVRYGSPLHKLTITTVSYGVFELNCNNSNGHDILLAFLQASLKPERIIDGGADDQQSQHPTIKQSSSTLSCIDIDGFTARFVRGRVENETWPEKISRRVGKVVSSLQEISVSWCDSACFHGNSSSAHSTNETREMPPSPVGRCNDLGLDEEEGSVTSPPRKPINKHYHNHVVPTWPSGLSMETEPELESVR